MVNCLNCDKNLIGKSQKKFCGRSCAATYNNRAFPKRQPESACLECQIPLTVRKRYCSDECKALSVLKRKLNNPSKVLDNSVKTARVSNRRRSIKEMLVEEHGGKCLDCGYEGPPFMFDFDHRIPEEKQFGISTSTVLGIQKLRVEANKCDLICANCHRFRTHKQRCSGCEYCF